MRVNVVLLAAVAVLWNRDRFPQWARPEFYGLNRAARLAAAGEFWTHVVPDWEGLEFHSEQVSGQQTLVIGDSVVYDWPWPADVLSYGAHTAPDILAHAREHLDGTHHYRQVVIWIGAAHFQRQQPVADYVDAVVELVARAGAQADAVYVVGPVPATEPEDREGEAAFVALAARVTARLRDALPGVPVCDAADFRRETINSGRYNRLYRDLLHLRPAGFRAFAARLEAAGFVVPDRTEAPSGRRL